MLRTDQEESFAKSISSISRIDGMRVERENVLEYKEEEESSRERDRAVKRLGVSSTMLHDDGTGIRALYLS
jgi:hypothetical protein